MTYPSSILKGSNNKVAKRVREGTIDISKYDSDSKTKKKIDLYNSGTMLPLIAKMLLMI